MKHKPTLYAFLTAALIVYGIAPWASAVEVPASSLKIPPMVPEHSVSTFVPSNTALNQGLAVNIIYPAKPRYANGAPIVVVIPGSTAASGLDFSMHAAQSGFAELRFALPGGGRPGFSSGGQYDLRGPICQEALRDILLFASGKTTDCKGRSISELVPTKLKLNNLGIVGWSNGGNLALATLGKYSNDLRCVKWLAFYESPIGSLFFPPALGGAEDLILNHRYRQGSCATGNCLIDFRKISWQADEQKLPGSHKRLGEPEIRGVVYFDENKNNKWDETSEFAFPYVGYPGFGKQIYPLPVMQALVRFKVFEKLVPVAKPKISEEEQQEEEKKRKPGQAALANGPTMKLSAVWPEDLATLAECELYFQGRDGSLFIGDICQKMPNLLVEIIGSQIDHLQAQPDHPHIAYLYNSFLSHNNVWVRLNPDPQYVAHIAAMGPGNFVDNKPGSSVDASAIETVLEPEGLIPDYVFMEAAIAELADRYQSKNFGSITAVITNYLNGAAANINQAK